MNIQELNNYFTVFHQENQQNEQVEKMINDSQYFPQMIDYNNYGFLPQVPFFNFSVQGFQNPYNYLGMSPNENIEVKEIKNEIATDKDCVLSKKKKSKVDLQNHPLLPKTAESERRNQQLQEESSSASQIPLPIQEINIPKEFLHTPVDPSCFWMFPQPAPKLSSNVSVQPNESGLLGKHHHQSNASKKPKKPHINTGHWSAGEHNTYSDFLAQYESVMNSSQQKKSSKIFKQMADKIGTRTPSQCRSHHQKFNPYASKNSNRRMMNGERGKAGRKKKNSEFTSNPLIPIQDTSNAYYMMQQQQQQFNQFWAQPQQFLGAQFQQFTHLPTDMHDEIQGIHQIEMASDNQDRPLEESAQKANRREIDTMDQFIKCSRFIHQNGKKQSLENQAIWNYDDINKKTNEVL